MKIIFIYNTENFYMHLRNVYFISIYRNLFHLFEYGNVLYRNFGFFFFENCVL